MPANSRSLRLTDSYRRRLLAIRQRLQAQAERIWPTIEELDQTDWPERMAAAVTQGQVEAVRTSAAYLTAFVFAETGRRSAVPSIDARKFAGKSADGRPLAEALRSPLIGTLTALKEGLGAQEALATGLNRATRTVGVDFDHAHRTALLQAIDSDDRFNGWTRVTSGTCAACLAKSGSLGHGLMFQAHAGCMCVSSPNVVGVVDRFPIPTGAQLFASKTPEEQDSALGSAAAEKVRSGEIELTDLVAESPMETGPDWITQRPLDAVST